MQKQGLHILFITCSGCKCDLEQNPHGGNLPSSAGHPDCRSTEHAWVHSFVDWEVLLLLAVEFKRLELMLNGSKAESVS